MDASHLDKVNGSRVAFTEVQTVEAVKTNVEAVAAAILQAVNINPTQPIAPQMITINQGSVTFKIREVPEVGYLEHKMHNVTFNRDFFRKAQAYICGKGDEPLVTSQNDLVCLEYLFFLNYTANKNSEANKISNYFIRYPEFQGARLVRAYVLFDIYPVVPAQEVRKAIELAQEGDPDSIELFILSIELYRQTDEIEKEMYERMKMDAKLNNGDFHKLVLRNCHKPKALYAILDVATKVAQSQLDKDFIEEHKIMCLLSEQKFQEVLEGANKHLKMRKPQSQNVLFAKLVALLRLGHVEEAEKFVRKSHFIDKSIPKALMASARGNTHEAFKHFYQFFYDCRAMDVYFWVVLEFCLVYQDITYKFDRVITDRLKWASQVDLHSLEVWQALLRSQIAHGSPVATDEIRATAERLAFLDRSHWYEYYFTLANLLAQRGPEEHLDASLQELTEVIVQGRVKDETFIENFTTFVMANKKSLLCDSLFSFLYFRNKNEKTVMDFANVMVRKGDPERALIILEDYMRQHTHSLQLKKYTVSILCCIEKYQEAAFLAKQILAVDRNFPAGLVAVGFTAHKQKDYAKAIDHLERISTRDETMVGKIDMVLFDCYISIEDLDKARQVIERSGDIIPAVLLEKFAHLAATRSSEVSSPNVTLEQPTKEEPKEPIARESVLESTPSLIPPAQSETRVPSAEPEIVRNKVHQPPVHHQPLKHDITRLDKNARLADWLNNPGAIPKCTIDEEMYPQAKAPANPVPVLDTKEYEIDKRLSPTEFNRLEDARQALIQIGDLLKQEKDYVSDKPAAAGNFLFPRTLMYHVMKFGEALAPTGRNQKDISQVFRDTIQTHILSTKLISNLRQAMRHEFYRVDMNKLKGFCDKLVKSTVLKNIECYQKDAAPKLVKGKDIVMVHFYVRTNIAVEQELMHGDEVDYAKKALFELSEMDRIGAKLGIAEIAKLNFYLNGFKMAICNTEECLKRLKIQDDRELRDIFYYGNRFAHEMSEDPTLYVNEEISVNRLGSIINKAERIRLRITEMVKS
jgi:tetratricopeptide (TPR) repeat protein